MLNEEFYTFYEYMKKTKNNLTASEEDYIEMIYRLCEDIGYTRVNSLSKALNVKPPSVSSMIKSLSQKEIVKHQDYGTIELTEKGKKIGRLLLIRHETIMSFFKLLDINDKLTEQTEIIEHGITDETLISISFLVSFFNENQDILRLFNDYKIKKSKRT